MKSRYDGVFEVEIRVGKSGEHFEIVNYLLHHTFGNRDVEFEMQKVQEAFIRAYTNEAKRTGNVRRGKDE